MPLQRAATGVPPGFGSFGGFGPGLTAAPNPGLGGFGAAAAPSAGFGGFGAAAAPSAGFGPGLTAAPNPGLGGFGAAAAPSAPAAGFGAAAAGAGGFGLPAAAAAPATTIQFAPGTGMGSGFSMNRPAPFAGPGGATAFSQQYGALSSTMSPTSGAYMNALRNSRLGVPPTQPTLQNRLFEAMQGTGRGNLHRAQYYAQNPGQSYTAQAAAAAGQQMAQPAWRGWGGKSRRKRNKRKSTKRRRRTNRR